MPFDSTPFDIQKSVRDNADGVYSPAVLRLQGQGLTSAAGHVVSEPTIGAQRLDAALGRGPG
jgi:hypothetical protein